MNNPEGIIYHRKPEVISGKLEDQIVMMDIEKGKYFSMNPVASRIWELLEKPLSVKELCGRLLVEFDVDKKRCLQEVQELIDKLTELNLLEIKK